MFQKDVGEILTDCARATASPRFQLIRRVKYSRGKLLSQTMEAFGRAPECFNSKQVGFAKHAN